MPDPKDPKYVPLWVDPNAGVQPMMDGKGGYIAEKATPPPSTLTASLSGSTRPQTAPQEPKPPVTPQVVAKAVAKLKEGAPKRAEKKKNPEDLMKAAQAMQAEIEARNAAMASQPTAVAPALERMRAPEDEDVATRLYRESSHWKGPLR